MTTRTTTARRSPTPAPARRRPGLGVWRALTAKSSAIGLILALGILTLAGTLLPQLPDAAREDPVALADWLAEVRPRLGSFTDPLLRLRLLDVFHSPLFATVAGLLALSTLACTVNRTPAIWRSVAGPRRDQGELAASHGVGHRHLVLAAPVEHVEAVLDRSLRAGRYRILPASPDTQARTVYADRFRYAALATLVAHAGLVIVLTGVAVSSLVGFRDTEMPIVVGEDHPVGHGTGLTVRAESFTDSYHDDGTPKDYASDLTLTDATGAVVAADTVRVNDPLRYQGIAIYQATYGVAAHLRIADAAGSLLADRGVPLRWSSDGGAHAVGVLDLPAAGRRMAVVAPASGRPDPSIPAGTVRLFVYAADGTTALGTELLHTGAPAQVGGIIVTFVRERQFTGVSIAHDPAAGWVWLGALLLVVGMVVTFSLRPRRVWARIAAAPEGGASVDLAAPGRHEHASAHLDDLVEELTRAMATHRSPDSDAATTTARPR